MRERAERLKMEKKQLPVQLFQRKPGAVWDCGSTLYDSFELNSLHRQLDSALSARSLSMPHLSNYDAAPSKTKEPPPLPPKKHSKVPRPLLRLFRSVFRLRPARPNKHVSQGDEKSKPGRERNLIFAVDDKHPRSLLTTIPEEAPGAASPDTGAFVRKTASERFGAKLAGGVPSA